MQKEKRNKIISIVVNVVVSVIVILAFAISINVLANTQKGYIPFFGHATVVAWSDSMEGNEPDSFKVGDALSIRILSEDDIQQLEIGDVIMFYDWDILENGKPKLNTHRIVRIIYALDKNGNETDFKTAFRTKGDHPMAPEDLTPRNISSVVGIYEGPANGFGKFLVWMQSKAGFFVCIILPVVIVAIYCVVLVVQTAMKIRKNKTQVGEKERLRREVLKELGIDPDSETGRAMLAVAAGTEGEKTGDPDQRSEGTAVPETAEEKAISGQDERETATETDPSDDKISATAKRTRKTRGGEEGKTSGGSDVNQD